MDGRFVPNLTFGAKVIESVRKLTKLPLDVHLMVVEPENYFDAFASAGANGMSIHTEVSPHLQRQLNRIRELGCRAGAVVNPATPLTAVSEVIPDLDLLLVMTVNPGFGGQKFIPSTLEKVRKLATMRTAKGLNFRIEIDGGIDLDTIGAAVKAGVEIFVAGNAVFGHGDPMVNVEELLKAAHDATLVRA
jgi:ribulose-phosphate 3-epimerase